MAETNFTQQQLQKLEAAIAKGVTTVRYSDKTVEYRSLNEMIRIRDLMRKELGLIEKAGVRKKAQFSKGL